MYKIRQLAEEPLEMLEQGVTVTIGRVRFLPTSTISMVLGKALFSGKHPRSSINQEDQNVVLMIWETHATSFLLVEKC